MKILVTGSNGVVGCHLVKELKLRGHHVWGCDLSHSPNEVPWNRSLVHGTDSSYLRADVSEWRQIERVVNVVDPQLVYHAAAEFGRWNGEDFYEQMWKTNVIGTKHILRLQELRGFKLVHFSSSEVYGDWKLEMSEEVMKLNEIRQLNDYAISKWVNEIQIENSAIQSKTESVIVRLFNTYGPGEWYSPYRSVICRFIYSALHNVPWVVHRGHSRSSLYLSDAARTLANIADRFSPGMIYNIASPSEETIENISNMVKQATGSISPEVFKEEEKFTTIRKQPNIELAIRDLGHCCLVPLMDGISATVQWMKDEYGL